MSARLQTIRRSAYIRRALLLLLATVLVMGATPGGSVAQAKTTTTTTKLVSVGPGTGGNGTSMVPSITPDGKKVAFYSAATDLIDGVTTTSGNVFLYDVDAGTTTLVSAGPGTGGNSRSKDPKISRDGKKIVFLSSATNLIGGTTTTSKANVYLYDIASGTTTLVSAGPGTGGNANALEVSINADGSIIAFDSRATDLVSGTTTNSNSNVFVYTVSTGATRLLSVGLSGNGGNGNSYAPSLSANGTRIAFSSDATDLIPGTTTTNTDNIFLYDSATNAISLVSKGAGDGADGLAQGAYISADGTHITYLSSADNLLDGTATIQYTDNVYLYNIATGVTTLVTQGPAGVGGDNSSVASSISADGSKIGFDSYATDLIDGKTMTGNSNAYIYDVATGAITLISAGPAGTGGDGGWGSVAPVMSDDGLTVAFYSYSTDLIEGAPTNSRGNVFLWTQSTTCKVTFDAQNGSAETSETVALGNMVSAPTPQPVKDGFNFDGWWTAATGGIKWDFATDKVNDDMTLFAHWTAKGKPTVGSKIDVLVVLKGTQLTQLEYLKAIGAYAYDAKGNPLPLSAISVANWDSIDWNTVNWPGETPFVFTLTVTDDGVTSDPHTVGLGIAKADTPVYPVQPNNPNGKDLPKPPSGYKWGQDASGRIILVKDDKALTPWPTATVTTETVTPPTPVETGDGSLLMLVAVTLCAGVALAAASLIERRKEKGMTAS